MFMGTKHFIIDFDSTFTKVEALDLLCEISFGESPEKEETLKKIKAITDLAMAGKLSFRKSLIQRISLSKAHKNHLPLLISKLKLKVSESFKRNKAFFLKNSANIIIMSNGFKEFIIPIVANYGIPAEQVYANTFIFDEQGNIIGFDKENPLSKANGKVIQRKSLNLQGDVYVIGDGYNDYEIRKAGLADKFYAFTENITREEVRKHADHVAPSFDEVLYVNNLLMSISYPKNRIKVLLLEDIHPDACHIFEEEGYQVETVSSALDEDELCECIKGVSVLGIRSKTRVTARVLQHNTKLIAVGAFCIGSNQIDLKYCTKRGVAVFNAPYSNTRSVVELVIAEIIMLMRNLPSSMAAMHRGVWNKTAINSFEIRGKKLGIIGYGSIGSQLSVIAEAMGMDVYYYDVVEKLAIGNATKCHSLQELLSLSDIISLHVDGRPENKNLIDKAAFEHIKPKAILLNLARGKVVDIEVLVDKLKSKKLHGAGIDVFPIEPKNNKKEFISQLRGLPNLILTPHIGGSTQEAQQNIGQFVPEKIIQYINTGNTFNSVNFPNVQLPEQKNKHRLLHIHENQSGMLAKIDEILSKHGANISGQYLKTNQQIGYVITDIDNAYQPDVLKDLKAIEGTIKFRVLY